MRIEHLIYGYISNIFYHNHCAMYAFSNAFTITLEDNELLYFYTDSPEEKSDWIKWLNVGAQLPFTHLQQQITPVQ